jgi:signal peptidase I
VGQGGTCEKDRFTEALPGGVSHSILNIEDGSRGDNTPEFVVPEDHVFVMGDNRDNSVDSRFPQSIGGVGFVPFENLLGRADRVIFSSAGQRMVYFWTWRADRFFEAID